MIRSFNFLIVAGLILAYGCAAPKEVERFTSTERVDTADKPDEYTLVYWLPRTTVRVHITAKEVITKSGPYSQYAGEYLGLEDVPREDVSKWYIENAELKYYQESDPDHCYMLHTNQEHVKSYFHLTGEGFILPMTSNHTPSLEPGGFIEKAEKPEFYFTDRSMEMDIVEETRKVMKMEQRDTAFVNVPVIETYTVTRTPQEKAESAAEFIMDLREKRYDLISGYLEMFPEGKAMESALDEFARLEEEYISLFTGKSFTRTHEYVFEFTPAGPEEDEEVERKILFRLSDSGKILPAEDMSGNPVVLELEPEGKTDALDFLGMREGKDRFIHRVPDAATVRLMDGDKPLLKKRILVGQYGRIISVPPDFLFNATPANHRQTK